MRRPLVGEENCLTRDMEATPRPVQSFGGAKTIGFFSSIILLINNITGPGIPGLPNMFVEAGWLVPVLILLAVWFMTTLSACMFCEAMERIPGNAGFRNRAEYATVVGHYFGRRASFVAQVGLNGALQSLNIISVVQSAQVMDVAISAIFGKTCALNLTPYQNVLSGHVVSGSAKFLSCIDTSNLSSGNGWGCHVVLSLGFVLTGAMAIPCGRWNLDDNMIIQRGAFVLTVCCWLVWLVASLSSLGGDAHGGSGNTTWASTSYLPAINTNPTTGSVAGVLGTILFNFGFVTTVPSWVNEKRQSTRVNPALWSATSLCVGIFAMMGIPAAIAFAPVLKGTVTGTCKHQLVDPDFSCANDLMQLLTQPSTAPWQSSRVATFILQASVYMFPIVAVVSSIPVFSIVVKYNLIGNGFSRRFSFFIGVVLPWAVAFPLVYVPDILAQFINFTSLLFVAFTDFIVPFSLYIVLQRRPKPLSNLDSVSSSSCQAVGTSSASPAPLLGAAAGTSTVDRTEQSDTTYEGLGADVPAPHKAFPSCCEYDGASAHKSALAALLGTALTILALVATYLTIAQGSYTFDQTTCALVGN